MRLKDFEAGMRVIYVPEHANGNENHEDCEQGTVSSVGQCVFVKFDKDIIGCGYRDATAKACNPNDLTITMNTRGTIQ